MAIDNGNGNQPLGVNWTTSFLKRHEHLKSRRDQAIDGDRILAGQPDVLRAWFTAVEGLIASKNYLPQDIWNMDEVGAQHNHHQSEYVIYDRRQGPPKHSKSKNSTWTTALECVNAAGKAIKPLVIHVGLLPVQPYRSWFPEIHECPNFFWGFTAKGWTTDEYSIEWFKQVFLPQTNTSRPRLLYVDGHNSHITGQLQLLALQHDVQIVWIMSHASHIIQPLDQQPFAQLKKAYSQQLRLHDPGCNMKITRELFNKIYAVARGAAFTTAMITSGFKRSGLWPFSLQNVLNRKDVRDKAITTPERQLSKTAEYSTPKRRSE